MELFVSRLYRPIASCRGSAIPGNKLFRTIVMCSVVEKRAFHSIKWNAWNLGQTPFHPLLLIFLIFLLFCCRWGQEEPKRKEGGGGGGTRSQRHVRVSIREERKRERRRKNRFITIKKITLQETPSRYIFIIVELSFGLPGLQKRLPTSVYRLIFVEGPHTRNNNRRNG